MTNSGRPEERKMAGILAEPMYKLCDVEWVCVRPSSTISYLRACVADVVSQSALRLLAFPVRVEFQGSSLVKCQSQ